MTALALKSYRNIYLISGIAITIFIGGACMLHLVPVAAKDKIADVY
jgi:hypothetical protein